MGEKEQEERAQEGKGDRTEWREREQETKDSCLPPSASEDQEAWKRKKRTDACREVAQGPGMHERMRREFC